MRFRDRAVVITGAGGGIGRAVARMFAAEGAAVVASDLGATAEDTAAPLRRDGVRAVAVQADVADLGATALPHMITRGARRAITMASALGKIGGHGFVTAYVASKHGVVGLTRALAAELGSQGHHAITVNTICPGYVRAGMGVALQPTKAGPVSGPEIFDRYYRRQVPLRRMIEPEEIGHAAVFLALPESAGITGQALNIDGGLVMS